MSLNSKIPFTLFSSLYHGRPHYRFSRVFLYSARVPTLVGSSSAFSRLFSSAPLSLSPLPLPSYSSLRWWYQSQAFCNRFSPVVQPSSIWRRTRHSHPRLPPSLPPLTVLPKPATSPNRSPSSGGGGCVFVQQSPVRRHWKGLSAQSRPSAHKSSWLIFVVKSEF